MSGLALPTESGLGAISVLRPRQDLPLNHHIAIAAHSHQVAAEGWVFCGHVVDAIHVILFVSLCFVD